jgi:hypothetical protein
MKLKVIKVDWRDIKSIKKAERKKLRLENAGWILFSETNTTLTYRKY